MGSIEIAPLPRPEYPADKPAAARQVAFVRDLLARQQDAAQCYQERWHSMPADTLSFIARLAVPDDLTAHEASQLIYKLRSRDVEAESLLDMYELAQEYYERGRSTSPLLCSYLTITALLPRG